MNDSKLFDLIDKAYREDLSAQAPEYKIYLLDSAQELMKVTDEVTICYKIYRCCHDRFVAPMTLPRANRALYQFV